jgi:hypothetical protein
VSKLRAGVLGLLGLVVGSVTLTIGSDASACGGYFGPANTTTKVEMPGEDLLYVLDGQSVEAHLQVRYSGAVDRFAMVLPVPALPEFHVGSQRLFASLDAATSPAFDVSVSKNCTAGYCGEAGAGGGGALGGGGPGGGAGGGGNGGPQVVLKQAVGVFEITVLQGGTAQELTDWLDANGYAQNPAAEPIIQKYLEKSYLFVAVKLTRDASTDQIHPLVLKYAGTQPCVPLQLSAISAKNDMALKVFFLAEQRVVPLNYKEVVPSWVRFDWNAISPQAYGKLIGSAVDEPVADGRAFVTEYAGSSAAVPTQGFVSSAWNVSALASAGPETIVQKLYEQGLVSCGAAPPVCPPPSPPELLQCGDPSASSFVNCMCSNAGPSPWASCLASPDCAKFVGCMASGCDDWNVCTTLVPNWMESTALINLKYTQLCSGGAQPGPVSPGPGALCTVTDPLVAGLLGEFLPTPEGVSPDKFYGCTSCYKDQIDASKWDAAALATAFQERLVTPGNHALELLKKFPRLTRLYTTISPSEMTEDPEFAPAPGASSVSNLQSAKRSDDCKSFGNWLVPGAGGVGIKAGPGTYASWLPDMPYAARIVDHTSPDNPVVLVDNETKIAGAIAEWNATQTWTPVTMQQVGPCGGPIGGGMGGASPMNTGGNGGMMAAGSAGQGDAPPGGADQAESSGGCATGARGGGSWALLALGLAALGAASRKRR